MTHIVQFIHLDDFVADLDAGSVSGIYHEIVEQRIASNDHGLSRWQMATIIRAIVSVTPTGRPIGLVDHIAALTIPHGAPITLLDGANVDPGVDNGERWRYGHEQHDVIVDHLRDALCVLDVSYLRRGILDVPTDLAIVYAAHPLDELVDNRAAAQATAGGEED